MSNSPSTLQWRERFEELLKVKNVDELKSELTKLATEIQSEIKKFDLNEYLSPTAKERLKNLETRYEEIVTVVQKAQKQLDRELNRNLRTLKQTRNEAEKKLNLIRAQAETHKKNIIKASTRLKKQLQPKRKKTKKTKKA